MGLIISAKCDGCLERVEKCTCGLTKISSQYSQYTVDRIKQNFVEFLDGEIEKSTKKLNLLDTLTKIELNHLHFLQENRTLYQ
jgi:hypothetical protein